MPANNLFICNYNCPGESCRGALAILQRCLQKQRGRFARRNINNGSHGGAGVPQWLEPSLSDVASAEEEGLDRLVFVMESFTYRQWMIDCNLLNNS